MKQNFKNLVENSDLKSLVYFLIITSIVKLFFIALMPITPQEAYYWYYSKNPDFSYFDHPPMAAYSIWLGTNIFGDNSFGVKFMAVVWSALTQILLFLTAKRFFLQSVISQNISIKAFKVVLVYNLTIFAHLYSVTIVPDTPLLFFWILSVYSIQEYFATSRNKYWLIAGISLGLGMLSKYSMVLITLSILSLIVMTKKYRSELKNINVYAAIFLSIVAFSPVLYWNFKHEWASFLFQTVERAEKYKPFTLKYFFQLIGSQLFMLTPFVFWIIIRALKESIKNWKTLLASRFLLLSAVIPILLFTYVSFKSLVKMNWLLPAYLSAIILAVHFGFGITKKWLRNFFVAFSITFILIGYLVMIISNIPIGEGNTWSGWKETAQNVYNLQTKFGGKKNIFIFGNSYKSASLLKFYLPDNQNTFAENIFGKRALQFDYWGIPDSLIGKNAIYVFDNRKEYKSFLPEVEKYFDKIELMKEYHFGFYNKSTRIIKAYLCTNYHGIKK